MYTVVIRALFGLAIAIFVVFVGAALSYAQTVTAVPATPVKVDIWTALWDSIKTTISTPLVITGMCSLLAAILPQGAPGTPWGLARQLIDLIALNMGNASNVNKLNAPKTVTDVQNDLTAGKF